MSCSHEEHPCVGTCKSEGVTMQQTRAYGRILRRSGCIVYVTTNKSET